MSRPALACALLTALLATPAALAQPSASEPRFREATLAHLVFDEGSAGELRLLSAADGAVVAEALVQQVAPDSLALLLGPGETAEVAMTNRSVVLQTDRITLVALPNIRGGAGPWILLTRRHAHGTHEVVFDSGDCLGDCRSELHPLVDGETPAFLSWSGSAPCGTDSTQAFGGDDLRIIELDDPELRVRCGPRSVGSVNESIAPALQIESIQPPRIQRRRGTLIIRASLRGVLVLPGAPGDFRTTRGPHVQRTCRFNPAVREFECEQRVRGVRRLRANDVVGATEDPSLRQSNAQFVQQHLPALRAWGFRGTASARRAISTER